ncbi:hypothetical protein CDAR_409041 [Caerostris darwini]|uniref:Uncharacterized protein n=1 Tax=Caerostris darwini TaxID=1538125 RepID=A0AAV4P8Z4_9ARAC|nr:hypothetical protein CDAR_409041 [Caerostris darwini]
MSNQGANLKERQFSHHPLSGPCLQQPKIHHRPLLQAARRQVAKKKGPPSSVTQTSDKECQIFFWGERDRENGMTHPPAVDMSHLRGRWVNIGGMVNTGLYTCVAPVVSVRCV